MTLYTQVSSNRAKTGWYLVFFGALIAAMGWAASYYFDSPGLLGLAGIIAIAQGVASYYFSDQIALATAGAAELPDSGEGARVHRLITKLSIATGLPEPRLYLIPDTALNAFATGRDAKHAAIAVTAGLVQELDDAELEGVLAHEYAHIGNEDIRLSSMVMVMAGLITLLADWMLRSLWWGGGRRRSNDEGGQFQAILGVAALVLAILAPIASTLIQLAISRKREFLADATAVLSTRYPQGLIRALKKIGGDDEPLEAANRASAHLYFSNPLKGGWNALFSTHPPIGERIAALEKGSGLVG